MAYAAITKPGSYMNTKLYTGTGSSNALTGIGFQPDLVWAKARTSGSSTNNHQLVDVIRAVGKVLSSDRDVGTQNEPESITAFGADGFTLGTSNVCNQSGIDGVAWCWKANGAGSANTVGSIDSTVSVNTTSGFSIVQYVGDGGASATIGHGLGVKPKMFVVKSLVTDDWTVYNETDGPDYGMFWNSTAAKTNDSSYFNDTEPTSTVFTIGTNGRVNDIGVTYIAYCFADVKGYSKFSSFTGNGNANGPFIYTGFKPAYVMIKKSSGAEDWGIWGYYPAYNVLDRFIYTNAVSAEYVGILPGDLLSNGFKIRTTDGKFNGSGGTYIYMAFAEQPLVANVGSGLPATAR